jgi:predicted type IV restriction endonuclease
LGISEFNKLSEDQSSSEKLLYCKIKGLTATGKRTSNGFVVFSGSQAVLENRAAAKTIGTKREQLINKGLLERKEDYLIFTKDIEFGSPSTAGGVVCGGSTNGLTSWRDSSGRQLKEIEKNLT